MDYTVILDEVKQLASRAGRMMKASGQAQIFEKEGAHNFVTQTDKDISDMIIGYLPDVLPGSHVISEESNTNLALEDGYAWIVDPIDGTSNYIYHFGMSAVAIGLTKNMEPVLGVVYNPYTDEMFEAVKGQGAKLNGHSISVNQDQVLNETLILAETDPYRNRNENSTFKMLQEIFKECIDVRILGSAALSICYIACGRGGVLFTKWLAPWDMAAANIILSEAGGMATHWNGEAIDYSVPGNIIASNTFLHKELLLKLREV